MAKHSGLVVFVGGPITFARSNKEGYHPKLKFGLEQIINVLEAEGITVHSAHRVEDFGKVDVTGQSRAITMRDFEWMKSCDIFVAFLPDENGEILRSDGTCVELGWASSQGKPIILLRGASQARPLIDGLEAIATVRTILIENFLKDSNKLIETIDDISSSSRGN